MQWMLAAWLILPAVGAFLWFAAAMREQLVFAFAIAMGALALLTAALQILCGFLTDPAAVHEGFVLFYALGAVMSAPMALLALAASLYSPALPKALGLWGYVVVAGNFAATLTLFVPRGFWVLGGIGTVVVGVLPFLIWVVWASVVLIAASEPGVSNP
jgi:hypothetical protein